MAAIRRADILMVLGFATDLATGQPRDFALRACVVAMRLAALAGLDPEQKRNVYHQALLRYIGCNADTHLLAAAFGDEIAMRQDLALTDLGDQQAVVGMFVRTLNRLFAAYAPGDLERAVEQGLSQAMQVSVPILAGHCEVARRIGTRLGLSDEICGNLGKLYERWDGQGLPHGLKGDQVGLPVRMVTLAQDAVVLAAAWGLEDMKRRIALRRDGAYEAALADLLLCHAAELLAGLEATSRDTILALEPEPQGLLDDAAADQAFLAIADMVDMRMPFTFGHSRAVAALAEGAGHKLGLPAADLRDLRHAALAHDIGELSVPVAIWLRPGPLSPRETDAAHLHPYHGERALAGLGGGAAGLVMRHHERLDGSGYHRGVRGPDLPPGARILAAAEAFQTAREDRPHRKGLSDSAAAAMLRAAVRQGHQDAGAAEAVLAVAGQPSHRAVQAATAGLTPRESEVLRLIAAGNTAKEAAVRLKISPKTADNHIQNLYSKIGVTTRAGAALWALERGLVQTA